MCEIWLKNYTKLWCGLPKEVANQRYTFYSNIEKIYTQTDKHKYFSKVLGIVLDDLVSRT